MKTESANEGSSFVYLFQIDSARENRPFFESMHAASTDSVYLRGLDFKVGPWTPDGMRVDLEIGASPQCYLTLIELEPTEPLALRSSRKYLHESSTSICRTFMQYLHRVIEDCDSRADVRRTRIVLMRDILAGNIPITVKTAGALRSGIAFLEESPLIDQTSSGQSRENAQHYIAIDEESRHKQLEMHGILRLSPDQSKALRRCLSILDAVIRQDDHSGAIYRSWRMKTPLKRLLKRAGETSSTLGRFILDQENSGITVDFDALLSEIVQVWTKDGKRSQQLDVEISRNLIRGYFPTAEKIRPPDQMSIIFETARQFLESQMVS